MKTIRLQTVYLLGRPSWWAGAALSFAAMMQGLAGEGIFHGMNLTYLMVMAMNFGVFIPLAPMAAILAVSLHLESAMRRACCYPQMLRCGKRRFVLETGVSAALAGGLALAAGWAAALALVKAAGDAPLTGDNMLGMEQSALGGLLAGNHAGLYLAARMILVFLYGFFCVCCAMPAAVWRQEAAVICLLPFVVLRVLQYLFSGVVPVLMSPTRLLLGLDAADGSAGGALLRSAFCLAALSVVPLLLSLPVFEGRLRRD